ncbi:unnamed protein product [Boreogadus saida]
MSKNITQGERVTFSTDALQNLVRGKPLVVQRSGYMITVCERSSAVQASLATVCQIRQGEPPRFKPGCLLCQLCESQARLSQPRPLLPSFTTTTTTTTTTSTTTSTTSTSSLSPPAPVSLHGTGSPPVHIHRPVIFAFPLPGVVLPDLIITLLGDRQAGGWAQAGTWIMAAATPYQVGTEGRLEAGVLC